MICCLQTEDVVMPYLKAFAKFRDDVRQAARQQGGRFTAVNVSCVVTKVKLML